MGFKGVGVEGHDLKSNISRFQNSRGWHLGNRTCKLKRSYLLNSLKFN